MNLMEEVLPLIESNRKKIPMPIDHTAIDTLYGSLSDETRARVDQAVDTMVETKKNNGRIVAVVGSGPNIHEGVTTLIAELIHKGIIDGVSTSSAVVSHEMAGALEKVKRVDGEALGVDANLLPMDGRLEVSLLGVDRLHSHENEILLDMDLYRRMIGARGDVITKVAGNMAYPTGLRTERLARDVLALARRYGRPFEQVAGFGADPYTMIGAGAQRKVPVLVTVPQLVGGGEVGLAVGDSISISQRCRRIADLMDGADVIIESAVALSQEIHDGPFERYTGHGIWAQWEGERTYSLAKKKILRIDLDPNLEKAWMNERKEGRVSGAVDRGFPKTKSMGIPFRMEMSGFARIPGSLPIVGDIGEIWPILAARVSEALDIRLDLMSYKQSTPQGEAFREWIVREIRPLDRNRMFEALREGS
jgi:hypothetical protein